MAAHIKTIEDCQPDRVRSLVDTSAHSPDLGMSGAGVKRRGGHHWRQVKAQRCDGLLPSPLWGGVGGGGVVRCGTSVPHATPPTPTRGGGSREWFGHRLT